MNIRKENFIFACTLISSALLSSCGGSSVEILGIAAVANPSIGISISNTAPSTICSNGGITIMAGITAKGSPVLSLSQVTSTQFVCSGANGVNAKNDLLSVASEPAGINCINGGGRVSVGLDQNGNGVLDQSEVTSFNYICNGINDPSKTNGLTGPSGANGANGLTTLSKSIAEVSGLNCPNGGIKITSGLDVNVNLVLDTNEVVSTTYVCNGSNGNNGNTATNGLNGLNGLNGINTLLVVASEASGGNCLFGGTKTTAGLDSNSDGILESSEINSTAYVCNGFNGTQGTNGLNTLALSVSEPVGTHCTNGGIKLTQGPDSNGNSVLDPIEVTSTSYICNGTNGFNGSNGMDGANGTNGANGLNTLVNMSVEPNGSNCGNGGSKTLSGLDINKNGLLDISEINSTTYVCNGINAINGAKSLIALSVEPAGAKCANGGSKATSGLDINMNGLLDVSEVTTETYVCNGINGLNTLVSLVSEPVSSNCAFGGVKTNTGLDTNSNGILEPLEVTSTIYVCNGITGAGGSNGFNDLVATVAEFAGVNCTFGGAKSTSGLDANRNAVLDPSEVTTTSYVCNGSNGLNGANGNNGTNGLSTLLNLSVEPSGLNCNFGGSKATSGLDLNSNNILESTEITSTTYICAGATGATGAPGTPGASGAGLSAYAYIYNLVPQTIAIQGSVLFDSNGVLLGIKHTPGGAGITVDSGGIYSVFFSLSGTEPSQFGLFVNGVVAPGSIYGSGAGTQQNNGQIVLSLNAGDTLSLVNFSSAAAVGLASVIGGTQANVNASVSIFKIN